MYTPPTSQIVDEDYINIVKVVEEMDKYVLGKLLKIICILSIIYFALYSETRPRYWLFRQFCMFSRSL